MRLRAGTLLASTVLVAYLDDVIADTWLVAAGSLGFAATRPLMMDLQTRIDRFLDGRPHAVVGASRDRAKYGNKVLRVYQQNGRPVYTINPHADKVEGLTAYPDLAALPEPIHGLSIITPPTVTETIVDAAATLGIRHLWMQPGAESPEAVRRAEAAGLETIAGDACLLVVLGYRERITRDGRGFDSERAR